MIRSRLLDRSRAPCATAPEPESAQHDETRREEEDRHQKCSRWSSTSPAGAAFSEAQVGMARAQVILHRHRLRVADAVYRESHRAMESRDLEQRAAVQPGPTLLGFRSRWAIAVAVVTALAVARTRRVAKSVPTRHRASPICSIAARIATSIV